ncbi:MAG: FtsQ-type POTRA domain-containing protein [Smithellaceae bacterium]|nr:FtsQ-type POTRA domain-containing protein [Smithellaceae bacterium]
MKRRAGSSRQRSLGNTRWSARKNRLKRRSGNIGRDALTSVLLLVAITVPVVLLILAFNLAVSFPYFTIKETVVRGCRELTEKDILTLADVKPTQNLLAVNGEAIARRVSSNPWVKEVFVGRELPDRLVVDVKERKALALLKTNQRLYLMDAEGNIFKPFDYGDDVDLPVLTGCDSLKLRKEALKLLGCLASEKTFPHISRVSEVSGTEAFGLSLFTDTGLCIRLGFDNYQNKLRRMLPVIADLERRSLNQRFLKIDLSDPTKVTVERKDFIGPAPPTGTDKKYRT